MQVTLRCPKDSAGFLVHFQSHHRLRELPELRVLCHWRWLELTDSALLCTFDLDQVPHGVTRKRSSITKAWVTRTWGFEDSWLTRGLDDSATRRLDHISHTATPQPILQLRNPALWWSPAAAGSAKEPANLRCPIIVGTEWNATQKILKMLKMPTQSCCISLSG